MYDIAIIGAGVVGTAIARELAQYQLRILLLDKGIDVGTGATKANSGIVHGGYTVKPGTLKGELCVQGNRMYAKLNQELNFGYRRTGALVLAFDEEEAAILEELMNNGRHNGTQGLKILTRQEALAIEPALNDQVRCALYCPDVGITSPYEFCIALAENAVANGVDLVLSAEVTHLEKAGDTFLVSSSQGDYTARCVINAAGVYSDIIAATIGADSFSLQPRKGQYLLLQRGTGELVSHVIFQTPTPRGKGVLVTSTYWDNLMLGPNAEDVASREDVATDIAALLEIIKAAKRSIPNIDVTKAIRSFSGIRAISSSGDFVIEESRVPGFVNVAGIDSPGLTSSPAIALKVLDILKNMGIELRRKEYFNGFRRPITTLQPLRPSKEIRKDVNRPLGDPNRIVCRCEQVTEQTIVDAIHRGIPINSTDAIKRRTRAGMGLCQGSFCTERVREIIQRETGLPKEKIYLRGPSSGAFPVRISKEELRKIAANV